MSSTDFSPDRSISLVSRVSLASVSIVVAMTPERLIGVAGGLPWRLPADLKRFRALTMGKPLIMGRRTHESIGRVLPGRANIVVTRSPQRRCEGCVMVPDIATALEFTAKAPERMVIGGSAMYASTLALAQRIYLTEVHAELSGDTYFPAYTQRDWVERERIDLASDLENPFPYSFVVLERRRV